MTFDWINFCERTIKMMKMRQMFPKKNNIYIYERYNYNAGEVKAITLNLF